MSAFFESLGLFLIPWGIGNGFRRSGLGGYKVFIYLEFRTLISLPPLITIRPGRASFRLFERVGRVPPVCCWSTSLFGSYRSLSLLLFLDLLISVTLFFLIFDFDLDFDLDFLKDPDLCWFGESFLRDFRKVCLDGKKPCRPLFSAPDIPLN